MTRKCTSTRALCIALLCVLGAYTSVAQNTGTATIQSGAGQSVTAGGVTYTMDASGMSIAPAVVHPGISNSGPVTIQAAEVDNIKVGRKLAERADPQGSELLAATLQHKLAPVSDDDELRINPLSSHARKLSQTTVSNSGSVVINGGTSGNTNIGRKLQGGKGGGLFVSNSGAVTINGGTSGNTNIGRRLQGGKGGGLYVENSGAVVIGGSTSGNTNIGRRLQGGKGPFPPLGLVVDNSGPVAINGGTTGNTNIGRRLQGGQGGGLYVDNSGPVWIGGSTSGNTNIGRKA